jgi:hypothetical protein
MNEKKKFLVFVLTREETSDPIGADPGERETDPGEVYEINPVEVGEIDPGEIQVDPGEVHEGVPEEARADPGEPTSDELNAPHETEQDT